MYNLDILDSTDNFEITKIGVKGIYNCDHKVAASDWVREGLKKLKKESIRLKVVKK